MRHSHGDHTGGVRYIRSIAPDIKVGMTELDWVPDLRTPNDFVVTDGMTITLGDFTITGIVTPGHTRVTLSFVFPVKDKGTPRMAELRTVGQIWDNLLQFRVGTSCLVPTKIQ